MHTPGLYHLALNVIQTWYVLLCFIMYIIASDVNSLNVPGNVSTD